MRKPMLLGALLIATSLACTVEADDNPFSTGANPVTSQPPSVDTGDEDSGASTSTGGGGSGGGSTDGGESTGSPLTTGPMATTTGMPPGDSSDDGGGNGMQPNDGMYSACTQAAECSGGANLCITIQDAMMMTIDGFCTAFPCTNPAVDCDPSPGGTATPICIDVTVNMAAETACALSCAGGLTCPPPMTCYNLTGIGEVCG